MGHKLINTETCIIMRKPPTANAPSSTLLVLDEEGDKRFSFPAILNDDQVRAILSEMNRAYDRGYDNGSATRARTICDALGIKRDALEVE